MCVSFKVTVNLLRAPFKTNCTDYKELPFHLPQDMDFSPRVTFSVLNLDYHRTFFFHVTVVSRNIGTSLQDSTEHWYVFKSLDRYFFTVSGSLLAEIF